MFIKSLKKGVLTLGTLLLVLLLIFEVSFACYSIMTKQNHKNIKNWIRVSLFIIFILLTITSVIVWSFRWVLLGLLLFVLALISAISLIRNKPTTRQFKTSSVVLKTIVMIVVTLLVLTPAIVFPQHHTPKVTGDHEVATATYTYTDENRIEKFTNNGENRNVNVEFWYPKDSKETYPLLVFSHGAYGLKISNSSTYSELASHGYVVVSIDHPYHSLYTRSEDGMVTLINNEYNLEVSGLNTEGAYTVEEEYELIQKWMKLRTDDMNFVLDTILEKVTSDSDPIYQLIDTNKIGVFGHSMGGSASVWLGKQRSDIDAIVNIDAPYFSDLIYDKENDTYIAKKEDFTTPLFNIYSDDVWVQLENNPTYIGNSKSNSEHYKDAYSVHFEGAKHLSFTDLPLFSPTLANMLQGGKADIDTYYSIETMNELILQFFDDKLKGTGQFSPNSTY